MQNNSAGEINSDLTYLDSMIDAIDPKTLIVIVNIPIPICNLLIIQLIREHQSLFSKDEHDLGRATDVEHKINTHNDIPVSSVVPVNCN